MGIYPGFFSGETTNSIYSLCHLKEVRRGLQAMCKNLLEHHVEEPFFWATPRADYDDRDKEWENRKSEEAIECGKKVEKILIRLVHLSPRIF